MTAAAWPVCTICYDDLRPLSDQHLHCIPSCGHVFHALCLEQWLEYCPSVGAGGGKTKKGGTCPICKSACGGAHPPTRLFFQSTGTCLTQAASPASPSQEADPEALAAEVARLEQKAASLGRTLDEQRDGIQKLNAEASPPVTAIASAGSRGGVRRWKEEAAAAEAMGEKARKEKEFLQQLLNAKTEEVSRKTAECGRLQERSLGLAKELAALKLSTDMNLEEEEILKLASLGNHGNLENAVDVLKRSLALRNKPVNKYNGHRIARTDKASMPTVYSESLFVEVTAKFGKSESFTVKSYKELMVQCNQLGRSETRTQQRIEKAKEVISKLKTKVHDLQKELEEKENIVLRDLRSSKKFKADLNQTNPGDTTTNNAFPSAGYGQKVKPDEVMQDPYNENPHTNRFIPEANNDLNLKDNLDCKISDVIDLDADDDPMIRCSARPFGNRGDTVDTRNQSSHYERGNKEPATFGCESSSYVAEETSFMKHTPATGKSTFQRNLMNTKLQNFQELPVLRSTSVTTSTWKKDTLTIGGISKQATRLASGTGPQQIHNLNSLSDDDFQAPRTNGLEAARKGVSKWCKGMAAPGSLSANANKGNLIAVGPDGRGGKVKVLRDHGRFPDSKTPALWPKAQQKAGGRGYQIVLEERGSGFSGEVVTARCSASGEVEQGPILRRHQLNMNSFIWNYTARQLMTLSRSACGCGGVGCGRSSPAKGGPDGFHGGSGRRDGFRVPAVPPYERPALTKGYLFPPEKKPARLPGFHTCVGSGGQRQTAEWYKENGIEVLYEDPVEAFDGKTQTLKTSSGKILKYGSLIISTGCAAARLPEKIGGNLPGVHYIRDVADADSLVSSLIIFPEDHIMPRLFTPSLAEKYEELYEQNGVKFVKGALIDKLDAGSDGRVSSAVLKDGSVVEADTVIVGIGAKPAVSPFEAVGVNNEVGGIEVDSMFRTSVPGIFAIGDVAAFPLKMYDRIARVEHVDHARKSAHHCIETLLTSQAKAYDYLPYFYSRIFEYEGSSRKIWWQFYGDNVGETVEVGNFDPKIATFWIDTDDRLKGVFLESGTSEEFSLLPQLARSQPVVDKAKLKSATSVEDALDIARSSLLSGSSV
uniref:monodehydroascorbate reductase (NADH) n=1 Tax=Brachypodium distachyon TaxID=15368 RepID=C3SAE1_BRADI|nr:monodehydroascorbate reductase [Brachypodium distachyon]